MSDGDVLAILTVVLCLGGSMFFSASETAIMSYGEHRARKALDDGGREAKALATWVRDPVRVLSTILVGNNIVNTIMGSVVTAVTLRHLGEGEYARYALPLAIVVTTAVLLLFGEIVPKALGRVYSLRATVPMLVVLNVVGKAIQPIIWFFTSLSKVLIARAVPEGQENLFRRVTPDEIDYLVRIGQQEGSISADQAELLRGIVKFENRLVRDIMVPEDKVTAIDLEWSIDRVLDVARRSGHSRLPVYEGEMDNVRGVLHVKQLVGLRTHGSESITRLMRPPMFVSESLLVHDLLRQFKMERVHLAVVVDDGGHAVGVVTLEDVLEQIVGQIFDETDRPPTTPQGGSAGILHLDGQSSLSAVEDGLGVEFDDLDGVGSVGDLLTQLAGQMPPTGSVFVYEGVRFKVLNADKKKLLKVTAERLDHTAESRD